MDAVVTNMDILLTTMDSHLYLTHRASGHYRYREPWTTARTHPSDFLMIWVTEGVMDATIDGRDVSAGPGDLLLLCPGTLHRYAPRAGRDWEWFWMHVDGAGAPELWTRLAGAVGPVRTLGFDAVIRARFTELVTTAATSVTAGSSIRADTCAVSLIGLMVDRLETEAEAGSASSRAEVSALTTWVLDHLDAPIGLTDLVRESGRSAAQLTRTMRQEVGLAPMQYVARLRIRRAQRLLADTELDVTQVARMVGFADPLHFSRRFRQLVGQPPSRARLQQGWLGP